MRRNHIHTRRQRALRRTRREFRRHRARVEAVKQGPGAAIPFSFGSPQEPRRDYRAFSREAYAKNVIAFRCVSMISRGIAALRWYATRGPENQEVENPKDPVNVLLNQPNVDQSWGQLMEAWSAHHLLTGNGYLKRAVPVTDKNKTQPRTLRLDDMRPDRMMVEHDKETGQVTGYTYQVGNDKTFYPRNPRTGQSNILHLKTFNPTDDYYGLSPVEPSAFGIDQHNAAGEWNYNLLKQGARPSAVVEHKPPDDASELSDEQRKRLKKEFKRKAQGPTNAGTILLLESYLQWKQMSFSPVDMDAKEMKGEAARDIATAYGVPPMLVGITGDATYANYKEARLALWEDTILPLAEILTGALNRWMSPGWGSNTKIHYDPDQVPAIAAKRAELWSMINSAQFLELNEKREAADYEPVDGGDVILVPMGVMPLETGGEEEEPLPEPEVEEIETDIGKAATLGYGRRKR